MLEHEGDPRHGQRGEACIGPLDERDRVVEVRLEVTPLRSADPDEAVEIEMGDGRRPPIEVTDREGRARDGLLDPEGPTGAPDERLILADSADGTLLEDLARADSGVRHRD